MVLGRTGRLFSSFFFRDLDFSCLVVEFLSNLLLFCLFNRCGFPRVDIPEVFLLVFSSSALLGVTLPPLASRLFHPMEITDSPSFPPSIWWVDGGVLQLVGGGLLGFLFCLVFFLSPAFAI